MAPPTEQPTVVSGTKEHALYLWIVLHGNANAKEVAKACQSLQACVKEAKGKDSVDLVAGVALGPDFYKKLGKSAKKDFCYKERCGEKGKLPKSAGDVFVHGKCDSQGKLFKLCRTFLARMPAGSIKEYEDVYGFVYESGRDLSGFIDGTANAKEDGHRREVAIEKETGGSYLITQIWKHDFDKITKTNTEQLEAFVGRKMADSAEIKDKAITSHVARMKGHKEFNKPGKFQIVRQSQPFGNVSGVGGLFFIAYAASPENLNFMLDGMFRLSDGGGNTHDAIMEISTNTKGTYWYVPSQAELKAV
ncbi:dye-decolorizing peroxidase YfeX-like [Mya arenaria]|uniref:dye-decolorizing peroxidase YfeX-like n=1 Tax=Mya arenaria TaxID=6604 RepID=UPI0022E45879|nr:dye-decolorizing peroxidase YfeX-like [Mya arenaria]